MIFPIRHRRKAEPGWEEWRRQCVEVDAELRLERLASEHTMLLVFYSRLPPATEGTCVLCRQYPCCDMAVHALVFRLPHCSGTYRMACSDTAIVCRSCAAGDIAWMAMVDRAA